MKKLIIVCLMIALVLIAGCGPMTGSSVKEDSVKIGAVLPLTGDAASYGEAARNAMTLAADEINAKGGVRGKKIKLIFEDNMLDASTSLTAVNKLIEIDQVTGLASLSSANTVVICPVAEEKKVPLMTIGTSDAITT
ncbi:ABC transporter substrate-binding protein, partial [Candidatus Woesearchaeota archaeon]|nr:ABC transporter substrate-binding protein [Candidatus Woesearchaeota archaeon]